MRKPLLKPKAINLTLAVMLLTFSLVKPAFAQALVFNLHEFDTVGLSHFHETVPFSSEVGAGAAILNSISIFRLIGPGPDNNFQMHRRVHRTINATGQITSTVDDTSVVCN